MHINVERYGKGKKIIFIHGSGLCTPIWYSLKDHLSSSFEVVLLDLPGHGRSSGDGFDTIEDYRDAIFNAINGTDLEGSYMAGHSLGGAIAMSFVLKYPEIIKGLILLGTGARLRVLPQIIDGIVKNKEKTLNEIIQLAFSNKSHDKLKKIHYNETIKCPEKVIYKDFFACDRFNIMDNLNFITSPTLIMCGEDDKLTPVKYSEYLKNHIKNSELVIIKDAGHMLFLEKPKEIADVIKRFIEKKPY